MKKKIGQRECVDQTLDEALQILRLFTLGGPIAKIIKFDMRCNSCRTKISISLSEDSSTGEIWIEGPDECPSCKTIIQDPHSEYQLSQDEIFRYFGKY